MARRLSPAGSLVRSLVRPVVRSLAWSLAGPVARSAVRSPMGSAVRALAGSLVGSLPRAGAATLLLGAVLAGGCGGVGREAVSPAPDPFLSGAPPVPPLRGEGFPFGRPPAPEVTVSAPLGRAAAPRSLSALLAAWTWPEDPNRTVMADVGWPPPLPPAAPLAAGETVRLHVPGVTFRPSEARLQVVRRSHYAGGVPPRSAPAPVLDVSFDAVRQLRVDRSGTWVEWEATGLPPGEWVLVFHLRWDAPIGGDATYLVPVRVP